MASISPAQKGRSFITGIVPVFTEVVIQEGTWAEHEVTPQEQFMSQDGIENITTSDKTRIEVSPTWMTITGQTPLAKGSSIVDDGSRKWVVTDITATFDVAGRKMQSGTWVYDETLSAAIA